jgi:hypothetical protein
MLPAMQKSDIAFSLHPPRLDAAVEVQLRRAGGMWIARVTASEIAVGIATSARAALAAAIEPLGEPAVTDLLADLGLLEPSLRVMEVERAAGA